MLRIEEEAQLDAVRFAPVIFQNYVPAAVDLRITIVGRCVYAAAIHSQESSYRADFRMDMAATRVVSVDLPGRVSSDLLTLMDHLGLVYGAIDMRLTPNA